MATIQDIKQRAQQVKDATQIGENTANRVGGVLVDIADHLEQSENNLSSLLPMDEVPTPNSMKPVQSGGVYENTFDVNHALGHINKLIGKGLTINSITITPVLEHVYQLEMLDTDWEIGGIPRGYSVFYLAGYNGSSYDNAIDQIFSQNWDTQKPLSKYVFRWKDNISTNGTLRLGIRAAVGAEVRYRLTDVTTDYKDAVVGIKTGYTSIRYDNLIRGHKYRVSLKNTEWQYDKTSGGANTAKFDVDSFVDETNYVNLVTVAKSAALNDTYEFTVPEDSSFIKIGGRANNGEVIRFQLEDITEYQGLQEEIEEKTTPQEVQTIFEDYLPRELSVFTLMNNKANVAFDSTTNKTVADSSVYKNFDYRKVNAGDHFKVYATSGSSSGNLVGVYLFDEAPVSAGIDGEVLYQYYASSNNPLAGEDIIIPRDGYMAIYLFVYRTNIKSFQLVKVSDFTDIYNSNQYFEEPDTKLNIPLTLNNVIDCTEGSETFGEVVAVTDGGNNYGSSDFISLEGVEFVRILANRTGATAYYPLLRTWSCGSVFYDENKQPLVVPENVPIESRGAAGAAAYSVYPVDDVKSEGIIRVPSEAKYLRVTSHTGDGNRIAKVSLYKKKVADVVESIDNNINDSAIEIVRQAQWVKQSGVTAKALTLLHFSDIHGDTEAADKLKEEMEKYAVYIDDNLCTGDVCQQAYNSTNVVNPGSYAWTYGDAATHGYKWWTEITGLAKKCLFVLGNHDGATNDTTEYDKKEDSAAWDGIGKDADYNYYFAPFAEELGITQPDGVDDPDSPNYHACYWLKDYSEQKIRLIGLDCMHRYDGLLDGNGDPVSDSWVKHATTEQENWLKSVLAETLDAENPAYGYSVLFACHYPLDDCVGDNKEWDDSSHEFVYNRKSSGGRVFSYRNNAPVNFTMYDVANFTLALKFNMRNRVADTSTIGYKKGTENHIGDIISSWINSGGKCIAWISGHVHNDYMLYPEKYPNIPIVAIDKTGYHTEGGSNYNNRNTYKSMLCANLYVIDTQNGYFKIIRLGVSINKQLTSKKYLCYDYINRKVLNEG